ncbi:MAG: MMPL family transporter [Desulfobacterales bacterium]|nr:MMPL family transporter [Desulfobacterales bacterium]MCP4160022.1 MMPL family transporter [Deltaproteobacteria bacterium]
MSGLRNKMEDWFGRFTEFIFDNRYKTLIFMICLVLLFISQLPKTTIDTSTEGFIHEDSQVLKDYDEFRRQFGRDELIIIALNPKEVFDFDFLKTLKSIHEELREKVPYVKDITSLINARNTIGKDDEIIVEDLLEVFPKNEKDLSEIKKTVLANPLFKNLIISENSKFTTIVIKTQNFTSEDNSDDENLDIGDDFGDDEVETVDNSEISYLSVSENSEVIDAVYSVIEKYRSKDLPIHIAGSSATIHMLKTSMLGDMRKFFGLAIAFISVFLFIMFRRMSGVILPLVVVILSLLSTLGLMAFFGTPLKLPTQILPSFILAVGVGDSVHVLVIFFRRFAKTDDKKEAISYAMSHSGLAILMTSMTTAGGLLSFSTAEIAPVADLGVFAAFGVLIAFVYTIVLLPALISILPLKSMKEKDMNKNTLVDRFINFCGNISTEKPVHVLIISGFLLIFAFVGILKVEFHHNVLGWFPKDSAIRVATEKIDKELKGTVTMEIIIDSGKVNGFYDPGILNRLEESVKFVENLEDNKIKTGKAWAVTSLIKEINKALHEGKDEYYSIPKTRGVITDEFTMFGNSSSDDREDFIDENYQKARFSIRVPFKDVITYVDYIQSVTDHLMKKYPDAKVIMTGSLVLMSQTLFAAIKSMAKSYIYACVIISFLMVLLIGKFRIGLLSMIPNLFPIVFMIGIMGWFNMDMDLFTMLVGSIALGLAVDDTIHFLHNFRRYFEENGDAKDAVMRTLNTAGRAMIVTTCVLSMGFYIFMFASMNNYFNFGVLTGSAIVLALLSDFFIAPALMVLVNRK